MRKIPATLLVLTVMPTTLFVGLLAVIGLPFWFSGVLDVALGNFKWEHVQDIERIDIALLFITAPIGLVGLVFLWWVLLLDVRQKPFHHPLHMASGIACGVIASIHLIYIKVLVPLFLFPAVVYALYRLFNKGSTLANEYNT